MKVGSQLWVWRFSSCEKKKSYPDEHSAESMAGQQRKKSGHQTIKAYRCRFCPCFHIGHTSFPTLPGPKIYCAKCDRRIPQESWDKHIKRCSAEMQLDNKAKIA